MNGFVFFQYLLPKQLLSRLVRKAAENSWPPFKNRFIRWFVRRYSVDLSSAEIEDLEEYPTFNAFFTRALRADVRPIDSLEGGVVSPCDGFVSQIGTIRKGQLIQAKGRYFTVSSLLANHPKYTLCFQEGVFVTLYLSPKDYHRVHMPVDGTLLEMQHVQGRLFSVNRATTKHVSNLFARNERVSCFFETAFGPIAIVLVGALLVSSIETVWAGTVQPPSGPKHVRGWQYSTHPSQKIDLPKGAEMGRFKLGSTVILLFPSCGIHWQDHLTAGSQVKLGELLGRMGL